MEVLHLVMKISIWARQTVKQIRVQLNLFLFIVLITDYDNCNNNSQILVCIKIIFVSYLISALFLMDRFTKPIEGFSDSKLRKEICLSHHIA
jgi:hypothetical protein